MSAKTRMYNPLYQQYWSMTPYRFGVDAEKKFAVKYTAKPRLHNKPNIFSRQLARFGWKFSLKEEMNKTLAGNEVWFDFYIQRYVDESSTPIENSKKLWREADSKPERVGTIMLRLVSTE